MSEHLRISLIHLWIVIHAGNENGDFDNLTQVTATGNKDLLEVAKSLNLVWGVR